MFPARGNSPLPISPCATGDLHRFSNRILSSPFSKVFVSFCGSLTPSARNPSPSFLYSFSILAPVSESQTREKMRRRNLEKKRNRDKEEKTEKKFGEEDEASQGLKSKSEGVHVFEFRYHITKCWGFLLFSLHGLSNCCSYDTQLS
ncbi:hypothetical protein AAC387_Pa11g2075 [Persea americana]